MTRVLVVDDSRVMQRLVASHLADLASELHFAKDGEEGVRRYVELSPDLVVSDIEMPERTGVELAAAIRALAGPVAKILLVSAGDPDAGAASVERGEADAFLPKPLDREALRRTVSELIPPSSRALRRAAAPRKLRVLLADDTEIGRRMLERLLRADPSIEIVGAARDGFEAVEAAERLRPDIVLLDAVMPGKDGITTTKEIMERAPSPVVLLTSDLASPAAPLVFEATRAGAVDVVASPGWGELDAPAAVSFRERIKALAEVPVISRRAKVAASSASPLRRRLERRVSLVAVCGSTGGPATLVELLGRLSGVRDRAALLIVQHILAGFTPHFAEWLEGSTGWVVRVAQEGDPIEPGQALLAPDGHHVVVRARGVVGVDATPPVGAHRPSGTPLFESAARAYGRDLLALLLTGMGEDGVEGLRAVRAHGGLSFVQTPGSCVVPGMPEAAIRAGLADETLTPEEMAELITNTLTTEPGTEP